MTNNRDMILIVKGRRCTDCENYVYKDDNDWHDMCNHGDKGLFECDVEEAESCHGYKEKIKPEDINNVLTSVKYEKEK